MKKFIMGVAALSMIVPTMASAGTAAQSLSVKAAAVQPVRASAKQGEAKAIPTPLIVLAVVALGGLVYLVAKSDSK